MPTRSSLTILVAVVAVGLLGLATPVLAHRCVTQPRACWSHMRDLSGAIEMCCLDSNQDPNRLHLDDGLVDRLVESGYLTKRGDPDAQDRPGTYRLLDGEVYCILHGFPRPDDPNASPRSQLASRGVTSPALLAEALDQRAPVRCWCATWRTEHLADDTVWLFVIAGVLSILALPWELVRTPPAPAAPERARLLTTHVVPLAIIALTPAVLLEAVFLFVPLTGPLVHFLPGVPAACAFLLAALFGLLSGVALSRRLHRRLAAPPSTLGDLVALAPDAILIFVAFIKGAEAVAIACPASFGHSVPAALATTYSLVLTTLAVRLVTAARLLARPAPDGADAKPAPLGLTGISAHPSRPAA